MVTQDISVEYLAGLIDGEGCIDMSVSSNRHYPRLRIGISGELGRSLLESCKRKHGGSINTSIPYNKYLPATQWTITGIAALRVLEQVHPILYIKKEQAAFAKWWIENIIQAEITDEIDKIGHELFKAMKADKDAPTADDAIKTVRRAILSHVANRWHKYPDNRGISIAM